MLCLKVGMLVYNVSMLLRRHSYLLVACARRCWHGWWLESGCLHLFVVTANKKQQFLVLDTQCVERGQLRSPKTPCVFLTAAICSRDRN